MKALVLCAGFGTRLGALTSDVPKPLLPILGEPLVAHTLRYLASQGVTDVAINLHYRGDQICRFIGDGAQFGVRVQYSIEEQPLGTAGAVRRLSAFFRGERAFLVMYGDLLTDQDVAPLLDAHRENDADATLLLHQRAGSNSRVRLEADGRIVAFAERPSGEAPQFDGPPWVNSGVYVVHDRAIDLIPEGVADFPRDVFEPGVATSRFFGVPLTGFRCAIDSPERYAMAEAAASSGRCRLAR